jgi:hypothetical protein
MTIWSARLSVWAATAVEQPSADFLARLLQQAMFAIAHLFVLTNSNTT